MADADRVTVELCNHDLECLMASVIYAVGLLRPKGDGPDPVEAVHEARRIVDAVEFDRD